MNKILTVLGGLGLGAALMYLYDPKAGRRRRALLQDKATALTNDARDAFGKTKRDLSNRAQGAIHEAKSLISGKPQEDTEQTGQTF